MDCIQCFFTKWATYTTWKNIHRY